MCEGVREKWKGKSKKKKRKKRRKKEMFDK